MGRRIRAVTAAPEPQPGRSPSASACAPYRDAIEFGLSRSRNAMAIWQELVDHSAPGDGSMVVVEKKFISDLRSSALELKGKGISADDAGKQLGGEFKTRYPD